MEFLWSFEGKENIKESEAHIITYGVLLDERLIRGSLGSLYSWSLSLIARKIYICMITIT